MEVGEFVDASRCLQESGKVDVDWLSHNRTIGPRVPVSVPVCACLYCMPVLVGVYGYACGCTFACSLCGRWWCGGYAFGGGEHATCSGGGGHTMQVLMVRAESGGGRATWGEGVGYNVHAVEMVESTGNAP